MRTFFLTMLTLVSFAANSILCRLALAALGGRLTLGESLSLRLVLASALIFLGIYLKVKAQAVS